MNKYLEQARNEFTYLVYYSKPDICTNPTFIYNAILVNLPPSYIPASEIVIGKSHSPTRALRFVIAQMACYLKQLDDRKGSPTS